MLQRRIDLQYMHPTFKQTTILKKTKYPASGIAVCYDKWIPK